MYRVEERHLTPYIRKGDLEDTLELLSVNIFKTKKAAKEFIDTKLRKLNNISKSPSVLVSYYSGLTGKSWINENSGEKCFEGYYYTLKKEAVS